MGPRVSKRPHPTSSGGGLSLDLGGSSATAATFKKRYDFVIFLALLGVWWTCYSALLIPPRSRVPIFEGPRKKLGNTKGDVCFCAC